MIYGEPVCSLVDGEVPEAYDGMPDHASASDPLIESAGKQLLPGSQGRTLLVALLAKGSVKVKKGSFHQWRDRRRMKPPGGRESMNREFFIPEPRVIAHRGASDEYPENTEPSFRRAIELGAHVIETDVHFTKDGDFVVAHDDVLDRVSDGTGKIAERSVEEIKRLDAAYHFSTDGGQSHPWRGKGVRFMTLGEMLTAFPDRRFNIDLKSKNSAQIPRYVEIIKRCDAQARVLSASEHTPNLRAVRKAFPAMATSFSLWEALWFYFLFRGGLLFLKKSFPGDVLQIPEYLGPSNIASDALVSAAHGKGLRVHVWTINEEKDMRRLFAAGVDGIVSDRPALLKKIVDEMRG